MIFQNNVGCHRKIINPRTLDGIRQKQKWKKDEDGYLDEFEKKKNNVGLS